MKLSLRQELAKISEEEFYELRQNIQAASIARKASSLYSDEEIEAQLSVPSGSFNDIVVGAFELTTRHLGILERMEDDYNDLIDDNEEEEELEERADIIMNEEDELYNEPGGGLHIVDDIEENHIDGNINIELPFPLYGQGKDNEYDDNLDTKYDRSNDKTDHKGSYSGLNTSHYPPHGTTTYYASPNKEFLDLMKKTQEDYQKKLKEQKEKGEVIPSDDPFSGI